MAHADLLVRIAHEVRSPLGVVGQVLTLLETDFGAQFTDEHRTLAKLAERSLRRLRASADRVRLTGELEAGSLDLALQRMVVFVAVRKAVDLTLALDTRRDVVVQIEPPDDPCLVLGDAERLVHLFTELVDNGIRHAHRHVRVGIEEDKTEILVSVEDDGEGIPNLDRPTLFRRFVPRASRAGLGIGLSLAHDLAVAHGGRISVSDSRLAPGRVGTTGARFVVAIPSVSTR